MDSVQSMRCRYLPLAGVLLVLTACGCASKVQPQSTTQPARVLRIGEVKNKSGEVVRKETFYIDGAGNKVRHGPYCLYYDGGAKSLEEHYVDGKREGAYTSWYGDSRKDCEGFFKDGLESGKWVWWDYQTGEKRAECTYSLGKIVGSKLYYYHERVQREDRFDEHGWLRQTTVWYDNGQIEMRGTFTGPPGALAGIPLTDMPDAYLKDGTWSYWEYDGTLIAEGVWKQGKPWSGVCETGRGKYSYSWPSSFARFKDGQMIEAIKPPEQTSQDGQE